MMPNNYSDTLKQVTDGEWSDFFASQTNLPSILNTIDKLSETETIYPNPNDIFRVFELAPSEIKVVILGQDPYYNPEQATGLAFSVKTDIKTPPSLKNIFKELKSDLNIDRTNSDLSDWHKQGVFLLNTALTVIEQKPNSHKKMWKEFTKDLLKYLTKKNPNILYVMWGNNAQEHGEFIEELLPSAKKLISYSSHPSPLSARHSFFGSKPFSWMNAKLVEQNKTPIKW